MKQTTALEMTVTGGTGQLRIMLSGDLTGDACPDIRRLVADTIVQFPKSVFLDMWNVSFIDTSGIGTLVAAHKQLRAHAIQFHLMNLSQPVNDALKMTRLLDLFSIKNEC